MTSDTPIIQPEGTPLTTKLQFKAQQRKPMKGLDTKTCTCCGGSSSTCIGAHTHHESGLNIPLTNWQTSDSFKPPEKRKPHFDSLSRNAAFLTVDGSMSHNSRGMLSCFLLLISNEILIGCAKGSDLTQPTAGENILCPYLNASVYNNDHAHVTGPSSRGIFGKNI